MKPAAAASFAWFVVAALLSVPALGMVNEDARLLVVGASTAGLATALLAGTLFLRWRPLAASAALAVSAVVTPTYFAWPANVVPLLVAVVCATTSSRRSPAATQP